MEGEQPQTLFQIMREVQLAKEREKAMGQQEEHSYKRLRSFLIRVFNTQMYSGLYDETLPTIALSAVGMEMVLSSLFLVPNIDKVKTIIMEILFSMHIYAFTLVIDSRGAFIVYIEKDALQQYACHD